MFSVVIPTYNRAELLKELLERLTAQTFKEFEVLVCDDGSSDDTRSVALGFQGQLNLRYFYEPNWGGPARPRNIGVERSQYDWVCFLDSDDLWEAGKLEEVANVIKKEQVDVIYHLFMVKTASEQSIVGNHHIADPSLMFEDLLYSGNRIVNSSLTVRRSSLLQAGRFSEDKQLVGVEDYDMLLKLAKSGARFYLLPKTLGEYRINTDNISANTLMQIQKVRLLLMAHSEGMSKQKIDSLINYMTGSFYLTSKEYKNSVFPLWKSATGKSSWKIRWKSMVKLLILIKRFGR